MHPSRFRGHIQDSTKPPPIMNKTKRNELTRAPPSRRDINQDEAEKQMADRTKRWEREVSRGMDKG